MTQVITLKKRNYSDDARRRMSEAHLGKAPWNKGKQLSEEHKRKISEVKKEFYNDPENRERHAQIMKQQAIVPWNKGKTGIYSEETLEKMSVAKLGKPLSEEHRRKVSEAHRGRIFTEEHRGKISESRRGENNPMYGVTGELNPVWQGGISFEPYCPKFNYSLKEQIRNRDNRTCVLCGKSEILNGQRLSVHHIDSDKLQGCEGKRWYLCALCRSCNSQVDNPLKEFLIVTNLELGDIRK